MPEETGSSCEHLVAGQTIQLGDQLIMACLFLDKEHINLVIKGF